MGINAKGVESENNNDSDKPSAIRRLGTFISGAIAFFISLILVLVGLCAKIWILVVIDIAAICLFIYLSKKSSQRETYTLERITASLVVATVIAGVIGGVKIYVDRKMESDSVEASKNEVTYKSQPEKLIEHLLKNSDADPTFYKIQNVIYVTYNIDPWSFSTSTARFSFNSHTAVLVPQLFRRYPDVNVVDITAKASLVDIRGNSNLGNAARITFNRANSAKTNWEKVENDNIPRIADFYWIHPSAKK